jgi:hypothetical protein
MLSMMAGSSIVLLAISLVHQCLHFGSQMKLQMDQNRTLTSLASTFRQAVGSAREVDWSNEQLVAIDVAGVESRFRIEEGRVLFNVMTGGAEVRQEAFELGHATRCEIRQATDDERFINPRAQRIFTLQVLTTTSVDNERRTRESPDGHPSGARMRLHVVAVTGRTQSIGEASSLELSSKETP